MYFITICTIQKEHFFGEIYKSDPNNEFADGSLIWANEMSLSELGKFAASEWLRTKDIRQDMNVDLLEFTIMPNHIHGIITIGENVYNSGKENDTSGNKISSNKYNNFGPQTKNLASIVRGYKSSVTMHARNNNIPFNWQARYHDHIIRSQGEYERIANYISNNVENWQMDKFYNTP